MAAYEQFTEYEVELEVPESAVQELDDNVKKGKPQRQGHSQSDKADRFSTAHRSQIRINDTARAQLLGQNSANQCLVE